MRRSCSRVETLGSCIDPSHFDDHFFLLLPPCVSILIPPTGVFKRSIFQVVVLSPGDTSAPFAEKFYKALGVADPKSFKPIKPPTDSPAAAAAKLWAVEYKCKGADAVSGWPLKAQGDEPSAVLASQVDAVRFPRSMHALFHGHWQSKP